MMKAPEPLYPCKFCCEDYSLPASDLAWSERYQDWVCGECWCDNCHDDDYEPDERGERLSTFLLVKEAIGLATLRAKAEAYDKGIDCWMLNHGVSPIPEIFISEAEALRTVVAYNQHDPARDYSVKAVKICKQPNEKGE